VANPDIEKLLEGKTIAVVGLSSDPGRHSYRVAHYMQSQGYRIIPVNPNESEVLGEQAYPDLTSVPDDIDVVDVFRKSQYVSDIVDEAIRIGAKGIWTQLGVVDEKALQRARDAGLTVVMNRCIEVEHIARQPA
jgi:predicted CoA-binding protein